MIFYSLFSLSYKGHKYISDFFTLIPPYIHFCTLPLWMGELDKKQLLSECFWSHMWPSFSLELGLSMCVVCVSFGPDSEFGSCQYWYVTPFTHKNAKACCHPFRPSILVSVKHETQTLFWFYGQKSLNVCLPWSGTELYGKLWDLKFVNFLSALFSDLTMEQEQLTCHWTNCEW